MYFLVSQRTQYSLCNFVTARCNPMRFPLAGRQNLYSDAFLLHCSTGNNLGLNTFMEVLPVHVVCTPRFQLLMTMTSRVRHRKQQQLCCARQPNRRRRSRQRRCVAAQRRCSRTEHCLSWPVDSVAPTPEITICLWPKDCSLV